MNYFRAKPEFIISNYISARETALPAIVKCISTSHIIMSVMNTNKLKEEQTLKACSNALDFVYHTTFDLCTLQSRVLLNTLYSAHYTRFDKSNRV